MKATAPFPTIQQQKQKALFTFAWVGKMVTRPCAWAKKLTKTSFDHGPRRRHTPASVRIPAFHCPGAASLSIGSSSLRGKQNLTREVSIHTNSWLTAMVVSKLISRFDAERRVHLLLIRLDHFFTSASSVYTFSPFRRRSASEWDSLDCILVPTTGRGWSSRRGTS